MPFFSKFRSSKKDKKKGKAAETADKPAPAPYRHVPTHAFSDSVMMWAGSTEQNRDAIKEATSRRISMMGSNRNSFSMPHYSRASSHNLNYTRTPSYNSFAGSSIYPRESASMSVSVSSAPAVPQPSIPRSRSQLSTVMTATDNPASTGSTSRPVNQRQRSWAHQSMTQPRRDIPVHPRQTPAYQSLIVPKDSEFQFPFQDSQGKLNTTFPYLHLLIPNPGSSSTPSSTTSTTEQSSLESSRKLNLLPLNTSRTCRVFLSPLFTRALADIVHVDQAVEMPSKQVEIRVVESPVSITNSLDFDAGSLNKPEPESLPDPGVFLDDAGNVFALPPEIPPEIPPRKARPFRRSGSKAMPARVDEISVVN
ncbi:MAG: hypothetical protein Q9160_001292 [Pyrenula sp. 1 TL-2023]